MIRTVLATLGFAFALLVAGSASPADARLECVVSVTGWDSFTDSPTTVCLEWGYE